MKMKASEREKVYRDEGLRSQHSLCTSLAL